MLAAQLPAKGAPGVAVVRAVADTYVSQSLPRANFGHARTLRIGPGKTRAYLRFRVPALSPSLAVAQLRVWVGRRSPAGFEVRAAGDRWREATVVYGSRPTPRGRAIASGPVVRAGWQTVDVTPLVRRGERTLLLEPAGGGGLKVSSRESRDHAPRLRLVAGARQPAFPIRAAFFYDWYPEAWRQGGLDPYTQYVPSRGFYDSGNRSVIGAQIASMQYAHLDAAIVSWWGRGSRSDARLPKLLSAGPPGFHWAIYDEEEGRSDPSVAAIRRDLLYLRARAASSPAFLRVGGRFVVFVYAQPADGCGMVRRWMTADTVGAYVVLKVFPGYRNCPVRPDGWHQYSPVEPEDEQRPYSFSISPGFFKVTEGSPRLARNAATWTQAARDMVRSGARFQLVTTFNEWGEGTAVESAQQWASASGQGTYLDVLHTILPARNP